MLQTFKEQQGSSLFIIILTLSFSLRVFYAMVQPHMQSRTGRTLPRIKKKSNQHLLHHFSPSSANTFNLIPA